MWDNRAENDAREAKGEKLRPDFSCKNKDGCGYVQWREKKADDFSRPATVPTPQPSQQRPGFINIDQAKDIGRALFAAGIKTETFFKAFQLTRYGELAIDRLDDVSRWIEDNSEQAPPKQPGVAAEVITADEYNDLLVLCDMSGTDPKMLAQRYGCQSLADLPQIHHADALKEAGKGAP